MILRVTESWNHKVKKFLRKITDRYLFAFPKMCGIAGILNLHDAEAPDETLLRRMLASLRHRGPDEFGFYLDKQVGIGNARLSIIDLQGGQQPIATPDNRFWIVFNGEIFNYVELRRELEDRGHRFITSTDTEVLLHLYVDAGPRSLERLNGQFAVAIWDAQESSLFLARDRLGVRPLFYMVAGNTLIFGSEIKAIACHPAVRLEMDPMELDHIFTYWAALSPRTVFSGVQELPPGAYLVADRTGTHVKRYWQLDFPSASEDVSTRGKQGLELDVLEAFRELLIDAVRIRLRADVPVGAYLSGGLDSSIISHIVRHYGPAHLDTFSIAFSDIAFDESDFQSRMARFLGTDHHVVTATYADIARIFPEVIWHTETPVLRTAPAPMFLLSGLVRDCRYKVVLTGEGADEFLAGYDIFKEAKIRRFWARQPASKCRPLLLQRLYPDIARLAQAGSGFLTAFFREGLIDVDRPDYSHAIRWRTTRRAQRFFSDALKEEIRATLPSRSLEYPPIFSDWGPLERSQYIEVVTFLSPIFYPPKEIAWPWPIRSRVGFRFSIIG